MPTNSGPFDIGTTSLILDPGGKATPKRITPSFFDELDAEFDGFAGHLLISRHEFDTAWPTWEMHPKGDEFVYLLFGDVDFVLWEQGRESRLRLDRPGSYLVVPRATWHTAIPRKPTSLLFVTPGAGTENAAHPS